MKKISLLFVAFLLGTTAIARDQINVGRRGDRPVNDFDSGRGYNQPQKERIILDFYDQHLQGENTLFLKQEIKKIRPYVDLNKMELISVRLFAKSKQGQAQASLKIGPQTTREQRINGSPYDFNYNGGPYSNLLFDNSNRNSQGPWQLMLKGNIKIDKVIVIVEEDSFIRNEIVRLNFFGEHFQKQSVILLKQKIMQERRDLNLQDYELKVVTLFAKSKQGHGKASLTVGQDQGFEQIVSGNPYSFDSNASYTYGRIMLQNTSYDSLGKWQIHLEGNIRVDSITVELMKKSRW